MFNLNMFVELICFNIDCDINFIHYQFLLKQLFFAIVKTKFTSIFVININDNKHEINEYVVVIIHVFDVNKQNKLIVIKIICEIHVVDKLKIKIFIDIHVIELK